MTPKRIGIVGSANMDLVARVDRAPGPGENVFGREFRAIPGGKGANQAVAAARLGAEAFFFGRVGDDVFGLELIQNFERDRVDVSGVIATPGAASGTALIVVNAEGQNRIIICPGANALLTPDDIEAQKVRLREMDAIVLQLEIPLETVAHAIRRGRSWGVPVILDAGPPCPNPPKEFFDVDVLSPNEAEAAALTGMAVADDESAEAAAREMLRRGARAVVIKRGGKGALLATEKECVRLPAHRVNVVDTTAAGDAFTAALAVRLAEGADLRSAVETANRAGALACARFGAQPSMPTRSECEALG